jgi:hypothetical protein
MLNALAGMRIIESDYLVEDGEPSPAWFRLGRSGWKVKRIIVPKVPYRGAMKISANTLVMHPETVKELRRQLARAGGDPHEP